MPSPSEASDAALIAACIAGDQEAFVLRFQSLVTWVVRRAMGGHPQEDAVEDLRQEVFLALFQDACRALRGWRPDGGCRPASWVGMIARQTALKVLAKAPRPSSPMTSDIPVETSSAPDPEEISRLGDALARLPPREALCLRLWVEQGLPAGQVADVLGVSRQTAYQMKDRALSALRMALRKIGDPS